MSRGTFFRTIAPIRMHLLRTGAVFSLLAAAAWAADGPERDAAVALYKQHHPVEAEQAFAALAAKDPSDAIVQLHLGKLALQRNDTDQAIPYLEKAIALDANSAPIHLVLGDAYGMAAQKAGLFSKLGWANKCKAEYLKAVELDPRNIDAHFSLMNFYLVAPGFLGGGADKALVEAQAVKQLDSARGRVALSSVYLTDKKPDLAFAEFEEVLKSNPDDYNANYQIGRIAAVSGERLDAGVAALRHCLELPEPADEATPRHAPAQWRLGNILEKKGDRTGARAAYEAALKLDPKFSPASDALKKLTGS